MPDSIISILGDSRAFDTYYYNADYPYGYGYQETFPFLLRRSLLQERSGVDLAHIPDHFRGGTIENNILRLGMTDPCCVVLINGIWETLVNKGHFLEYVKAQLEQYPTSSKHQWDFSYSGEKLIELFVANKLSNSPERYAERQRTIISFFRRRRREVINISLPQPDATHLGRLHYAGAHRLIDEWDLCLAALNKTVAKVVKTYNAQILDAHALMLENGGQAQCLIDQWHFTPSFHRAIAKELERKLETFELTMQREHVSHSYMIPGGGALHPLAVTGEHAALFAADHPDLELEIVPLDTLGVPKADVVVLAMGKCERIALESRLLQELPQEKILVYPEELFDVNNPLTVREGKDCPQTA